MARAFVIETLNWDDERSVFLINPKLAKPWQQRLHDVRAELPDLPAHLWVLSSGSSATSQFKWIALSKRAFLTAAAGANAHLQSDASDKWLLSLPEFHVGGLSIGARAHLSGATVIRAEAEGVWNPTGFLRQVRDDEITLVSLVPTQVFDLVQLGMPCPPSLRAIVVGGGALSESLYLQARRLGFPILPSYGLTECGSQVATASLESLNARVYPGFRPLPHVQISFSDEGCIQLQSEALLSGWALISLDKFEFVDPKVNGVYRTEDLGRWQGGELLILGRKTDVVKVGGELVSVPRLQEVLQAALQQVPVADGTGDLSATLVTLPDERLGQVPVLVLETTWLKGGFEALLQELRKRLSPFEFPRAIYFVRRIPRTDLKKLKTAELKQFLGYEGQKTAV